MDVCPICGEEITEPDVADDGETLNVLGTPDGPAHTRCCADRCGACRRLVSAIEGNAGLWIFRCCGVIWIPVVSETSLDGMTATL